MLTGMIIPTGALIVYKKKLHTAFVNRILSINAIFLFVICQIIIFFVIIPQPGRNKLERETCNVVFIASIVISTFVGKLMLTEFDKNDDLLDSFIAVTRSNDDGKN